MDEVVIMGVNLTCAVSALQQGAFPDKDCFLTLVAKALGYAIIVFSTILRLPQILIILRNKSVEGLAMASFEIECVGYTVAVSYCTYKQLPFSTYGELFFLLIQSYILVLLIYYYTPQKQGAWLWFKIGVYLAAAPVFLSGSLPGHVYETLYNGQTALFNLGRLPQLWSNYKNKSTGQLSFLSSFLSAGGCVARLFTSLQEKAPTSMVIGSIWGLFSHGTLTLQILLYSPPDYVAKFLPWKVKKAGAVKDKAAKKQD